MIHGSLNRTSHRDKQTTGTLVLTDATGRQLFKCNTLELPWLNNKVRQSCIPTGSYEVKPRTSAKFGKHLHITDVPNRSYILIHSGNFHTQILGCVLVGDDLRDINGDNYKDVVNSRKTLAKLLEVAPNGFQLCVQ